MADTRYFSVPQLARHQHYRDRAPPWIKLHASTLDDYDFAALPDAAKAHLMQIWLVASRMGNRVPWDAAWLARRINATDPIDLDALVAAGFIAQLSDSCTQDASAALSDSCTQDASAALSDSCTQDASAALSSRASAPSREGEGEAEGEAEGEQIRARTQAAQVRGSGLSPVTEVLLAVRQIYPRRSGAQPWTRAERAIGARLRAGEEAGALVEGCRRYARWCECTGKVGRETVMQAATFFGPERHFAAAWPAPNDWLTGET